MTRVLAPMVLAFLAGCAGPPARAGDVPPSQAPEGFWEHWGDGRAELASYDLVQPRYGVLREGTAVLVYVTETFTAAQRVKSDGGHDDELPVIKLNEVRDFQTGIYDYNVLTSTFVPLDGSLPRGQATKVSFSSQEWCGHVYDQLIVDPGRIERTWHSYFDGEADGTSTDEIPAGGVFADAMPILVRDLAGPLLDPGGTRTVPWYPRLLDARFAHQSPAWTTATLTRSAAPETVEVPAGSIEAWTVTAAVEGGPTTTFWVEAAAPHRLVRWTSSTGESGALRGSARLAYWRLNGPEGAEHLADIGLPTQQ